MDIYGYLKEKFLSGEFDGYGKKRILSEMNIKADYERKAVEKLLRQLEDEGVIIFFDGKFTLPEKVGLIKGEIKGNERGYAFLIPEDKAESDIFIPNKRLCGALHKDTVLVQKLKNSDGNSPEGEVVKVLKRGITKLCGTYYTERNFGFVRPDDKNYFDDIFVSFKNSGVAKSGDKVAVDIVKFHKDNNPEGVVTEIFGRQYDLAAEEESIIYGFGYAEQFPKKALIEAAAISQEVQDNQLIGRLNLTDELIITIDGDDSRDFDDAVNVKIAENGNYILGVHIADVSEYVTPHSALDNEAFERSTSVYFPDRVIPMLPEELSNGICSLNEGVTRLTLSCIMEIDKSGNVVDKRIAKSVIKSKHRMTYKNVQAMIDGNKEIIDLYADIYPMIKDMYALKNILSEKRAKRGNIDLDVKEADIGITDDKVSVKLRTSVDAYKIIEEFMVLANECIAEYAFYLDVPFIYRIHEKPSTEKAQGFIDYLNILGINVKFNAENCYPSDFSNILSKVSGTDIFSIVNRIMLRSMQKARYSPENKGHFGLSSKCYCHFTSPIRRYPDLIVHRVIKSVLEGEIGELIDLYGGIVSAAAENSSVNERKADDAEREVDVLYKVKYMEDHIGEEFDAVISGVTSLGVYCELENTIEGFTSVKDLPRGQYKFDEKTYSLKSSKYCYKLGDRVRIGVLGADIASKRIDFIILTKNLEKSGNIW